MFEYDNVYDDMQGKKAEQVKAKTRTADKKVSFSHFPLALVIRRLLVRSSPASNIIGIKYGFSCINIHQVPWEVCFQHLPRDLANVNALKKHV